MNRRDRPQPPVGLVRSLRVLTLFGDSLLFLACAWLLYALPPQAALPLCALAFWAWQSEGGFSAWRS
ncbi:MAG TPA: hypothetical protein DDW98_09060 [Gammaproteobacteria bacterium]|nr:hypothetical protein [Gammaproteobacteria bacterium]